jgi:glycyl-tRNA synthetase
MLDRAGRIATLATRLAASLDLGPRDRTVLARAAELVKFDLASQMVIELTSLAGTMAQHYALAAGEEPAVAQALLDVELPRAAGDRLPSTAAGALLAVADRLDALVGLAATVGIPTGSSDPFAVRRAGLGLLTLCRTQPVLDGLSTTDAARVAATLQPVPVDAATLDAVAQFLTRRLEQQLTDDGHPVDRVRAVLLHADRPRLADRLLGQLDALVGRPDFGRVAAALQRARRIVPSGTPADYDLDALVEPAERRLHEAVVTIRAEFDGRADLMSFTATAARLADPVEQFFTDVLVMADDPALRRARLGLLAAVRDLGDGQIAWQELRI